MMKKVLLFCYGTLKKKGKLHIYLEKDGAEYKGDVFTGPNFCLYRISWFPGMVEDSSGPGVYGELYEIPASTLIHLDRIEGVHSGLFRRHEITLSDGQKALTYLFNQNVDDFQEVENGSWPI